MQPIDVTKNKYPTLYVDLTYKCNFECRFCYNPKRDIPDMDIEYFEEVCRKLPGPVLFRFLGGEPTLHPHFFSFLEIAAKYRHTPSFVTNGTKLNSVSFVKDLAKLKFLFYVNMSMDGGRNNDDVYEYVTGRRCSQLKMTALKNLIDAKISRLGIGAIVVRDINEFVIPDLISLSQEYSSIRYIHFRSAGLVGRHQKTEPYKVADLKKLILKHYSQEELSRNVLIDGLLDDGDKKCNQCCFYFRPNNKVRIALVEFASDYSRLCWRRGKLKNQSFEIVPWFEDMVQFSETIPLPWKA